MKTPTEHAIAELVEHSGSAHILPAIEEATELAPLLGLSERDLIAAILHHVVTEKLAELGLAGLAGNDFGAWCMACLIEAVAQVDWGLVADAALARYRTAQDRSGAGPTSPAQIIYRPDTDQGTGWA